MDVSMNSWGTEVEASLGRPVMSGFHAMWSLGAGAGAGLGFAATAAELPVAVHFALAALLALLLLGPFLMVPWRSERRQAQGGTPVFALPRGPLVAVGLIALASGLGEGATADWSAIYLSDVAGTSASLATLGYAAFSVSMVAMRLCTDRLVGRFGAAAVARAAGLTAATGILLVVLPGPWGLAMAGFLLMGLGYAPLYPLAFSRAAAEPGAAPGQAIAAVATLGYGSILLGPPVIGAVAGLTSLRTAFLLVGVAALMAAALAPMLERRARPLARAA
ncbi:MFS transporter [Poseidonocella sp. HB161398]|uniref:MFS transporter n=1 Tax=Poseidonocella sp. HB161398 TaxID=2320855 RepID=UPI003519C0A0